MLAAVVPAQAIPIWPEREGRSGQSEVGGQRHRAFTHILPLNTSILGPDSRFTDGGQIGACDCQEGPTTKGRSEESDNALGLEVQEGHTQPLPV